MYLVTSACVDKQPNGERFWTFIYVSILRKHTLSVSSGSLRALLGPIVCNTVAELQPRYSPRYAAYHAGKPVEN